MPSTFLLHMVLILTDGSNMAIVDIGISEHIIDDGACLKLWDWKSWQLHYGVNMEVDEVQEIAALAFHPEEFLARIFSHSHLKCGYQLAQRRRIGRAEDVTQLTFKYKTNAVGSTSLWWNQFRSWGCRIDLSCAIHLMQKVTRVLASSMPAVCISLLTFCNNLNFTVAALSGTRCLTKSDLSTCALW